MTTVTDTLEARFREYHAANPGVYDLLVMLARQWVARTGRKIGIAALFERARWEFVLAPETRDFRFNNSYRAYYVRLIELQEPDLAGLFEKRRSAADDMDLVGSFPVGTADPAP